LIYTDSGRFALNTVQLLITDRQRRNIAYVCVDSQEGLQPIGTAFFVEVPWGERDGDVVVYAVTARHCVEEQVLESETTYLEFVDLKRKAQRVPVGHWMRCDFSDIACCRISREIPIRPAISTKYSFLKLDFGPLISRVPFQIGMEVFIVGLFSKAPYGETFYYDDSQGKDELIPQSQVEPIVRFGKVSLPHTVIPVYFDPRDEGKRNKHTMIESILIESVSFAGESGSPVFMYEEHTINGSSLTDKNDLFPTPRRVEITDLDVATPLLGMISSHWRVPSEIRSPKRRKLTGDVGLNSGIAVVIPAWHIKEFILNDSEVKRDRDKVSKRPLNDPASPLAVKQEKRETEFTKSDFETALRKVSRRLRPSRSDGEK
jgi:hypothetical protein